MQIKVSEVPKMKFGDLQVYLLRDKGPKSLHCLTGSVVDDSIRLGMLVGRGDQVLGTCQVKVPTITAGLQEVKKDQEEDASHRSVLFGTVLIAQGMRQSFHSLMLEGERIAIRIDET